MEVTSGPAEVIVLAEPPRAITLDEVRRDRLALIDELRHRERTEEEERVLDEFEDFRRPPPGPRPVRIGGPG